MSTSAITRSTREFPLETRDRRSIERRVREAQAKLLRTRELRSQQRRATIASREDRSEVE